MSRIFGEIRQIAFVVNDIDAAMSYWHATLGIGPFFIKRHITFGDYYYRGEAGASPQISIALANSGTLQIELIQQHDQHASIYKEFLDRHGHGLQHIASWQTCAGFDLKKQHLLEQGYTLAQECTISASGVRLAYFATDTTANGIIFEIADLLEPVHYTRINNIAMQAQNWDGSRPVHEVST